MRGKENIHNRVSHPSLGMETISKYPNAKMETLRLDLVGPPAV